ncbi:Glucuronoxylanase XynC precursor [compost metagenome]
MAHFSKFVRPGYVRVDATKNPNTNVYTSAYKGDNKVVIVAVNKSTSAVSQNFNLQNGTISKVSSWITDSRRNLAAGATINASSNSFAAQLPAQSVTTFVAELGNGNPGNPGSSSTIYEAETDTTLTDAVVEKTHSGYLNTLK